MVKRREEKELKHREEENAHVIKKVKKSKDKEEVLNGPIVVNIEAIEDELFDTLLDLMGESILVVTESDQLNLFGQTFRPIFCGTVFQVTQSYVTLFPVQIKMINAPFFEFPTPLSFPLEKIAHFTPDFNCNDRIPLT